MKCLMALLALASSLSMASSLLNVPPCTLYEQLFLNLLPGSLMRLGLTCHLYNELATAALATRFTKICDGQRVFDIELLYDIYQSLDGQDDSEEKLALQRLIKLNYPSLKGNCRIQSIYEEFKSYLFDPEAASAITSVYNQFPEVSRMVLKYKDTVDTLLRPDQSFLEPQFIELALKRMGALEDRNILNMLREADPREVKHLFDLLKEKSESVQRILSTGNPEFLIQDGQMVTFNDVALVCCMADELDSKLIGKIIDKFPGKLELIRFLPNWMNRKQMKFISLKLCELVNFEDLSLSLITNNLGRPETYAPIEFYRALRGYRLVDTIFDYLRTYDEEKRVYAGDMPVGASGRLVFEAALMLDLSDNMLYSIMSLNGFVHDSYLVTLCMLKNRSSSLIIDLLKTEKDNGLGNDNIPMSMFKLDVHPEVFSHILHNSYFEDPFMNISLVHYGGMNPDSQLENWKTLLDHGHLSGDDLHYLLDPGKLVDFERAEEMITLLTQYAYKHRIACFWDLKTFYRGNFKGAMAFFDSLSTEEVIAYQNSYDAEKTYESLHKTVGNSYFLAVRSVLARDGGYQALSHHVTYDKDFHTLLLFAGHPKVDYMKCLCQITKKSLTFVKLLKYDPEFVPIAHRFLDYLCEHADNENAMKCLVQICNAYIMERMPFRDLFPLHHLADQYLGAFFTIESDITSSLRHAYYGPRLAKFFASKNLIPRAIWSLVKYHNVTSYADIKQNWLHLFPYLDQDLAVTDEIISKISAEQQ